jgi:hypothetical protein
LHLRFCRSRGEGEGKGMHVYNLITNTYTHPGSV